MINCKYCSSSNRNPRCLFPSKHLIYPAFKWVRLLIKTRCSFMEPNCSYAWRTCSQGSGTWHSTLGIFSKCNQTYSRYILTYCMYCVWCVNVLFICTISIDDIISTGCQDGEGDVCLIGWENVGQICQGEQDDCRVSSQYHGHWKILKGKILMDR